MMEPSKAQARVYCINLDRSEATTVESGVIPSLRAGSIPWSDIPAPLRASAVALSEPQIAVRVEHPKDRLAYGFCTHIIPASHTVLSTGHPNRRFLIELVDADGGSTSVFIRIANRTLLRSLVSNSVFVDLLSCTGWPVDVASSFFSTFDSTCPTCYMLASALMYEESFVVDHACHPTPSPPVPLVTAQSPSGVSPASHPPRFDSTKTNRAVVKLNAATKQLNSAQLSHHGAPTPHPSFSAEDYASAMEELEELSYEAQAAIDQKAEGIKHYLKTLADEKQVTNGSCSTSGGVAPPHPHLRFTTSASGLALDDVTSPHHSSMRATIASSQPHVPSNRLPYVEDKVGLISGWLGYKKKLEK